MVVHLSSKRSFNKFITDSNYIYEKKSLKQCKHSFDQTIHESCPNIDVISISTPQYSNNENMNIKTKNNNLGCRNNDLGEKINENTNNKIEEDEDDEIDLFADSISTSSLDILSNIEESNDIMDANDWDDNEGRLRYKIGEVINNTYKVIGYYGKGTFGNVLRVTNTIDNNTYAIKIARSHHEMNTAFKKEKYVLEKLSKMDKTFCVSLIEYFDYKNHNCLVLEAMKESGRELLSRIGSLSLNAIKIYGNQLLRGLFHIHNIGFIHADIKPDNFLIGENQITSKLCDFGTAIKVNKNYNNISSEYGSLYYRSPEIILGYDISTQVDIWSIACCLIELFTGKILFKGKHNNNMLELFMNTCGCIPKKLLKRSLYLSNHFDSKTYEYQKLSYDKITGKNIYSKQYISQKPKINIYNDILLPSALNTKEEKSNLLQFADLLQKMLIFDPLKRITLKEALSHPFFT